MFGLMRRRTHEAILKKKETEFEIVLTHVGNKHQEHRAKAETEIKNLRTTDLALRNEIATLKGQLLEARQRR